MILTILLTSSVMTTVFAAFSFYNEYLTEKENIEKMLRQIEVSNLTSLSTAIWNYDTDQIKTQAGGILALPDIVGVRIFDDASGKFHEQLQDITSHNNIVSSKFELMVYTGNSQENPKPSQYHKVGFLEVLISEDRIYHRFIYRITYFFLTQGFKTLVVSMIMLFIFRWFIFRHIRKMASFVRSFDMEDISQNDQQLELDSSFDKSDELSVLKDSINQMIGFIRQYESSSRKDLEMQKAMAINAARLASLGDLAGGLAHEINNPLAIIQNASSQLIRLSEAEQNNTFPAIATRNLKIIEKNTWRIVKIIQSLRKFARQDDQLTYQDISTETLLKDAMEICEGQAELSGTEIRIHPTSAFLKINCIPNEITQILTELIQNALWAVNKHEGQRWIEILTLEEDAFVIFSMTNSGPKLSGSIADRIFNPFFTTKDVGQGMGLGLSIASGVAKRYGGTLKCDLSGDHTRFILRIPVEREANLV